jgi:mono/diheme cytochrome c family protein
VQFLVLIVMRLATLALVFFKRHGIKGATGLRAVFLSGLVMAQPQLAESERLSRGAYLARAGDCNACHTADPPRAPFAGGRPINSPFGVIYSTNITPDPDHGIGKYTLEDFSRAVRSGIARDGHYLYPAMPYPSFSAIRDEDIRDLYDYFMHEVAPVSRSPPETELPFPFNIRETLFFWSLLFVEDEHFKPRNDRDEQWNRGAYLVQSLGHCGACHTPRGLAFQEKAFSEASRQYLSGAVVDNWFAVNLRGDPASGLGRWSENDIVLFLKAGQDGHTAAFGSMTEVIESSTQYLRDDDLHAIASYLKSLPPHGEKSSYQPEKSDVAVKLAALKTGSVERPGAGLYQAFCAKCHKLGGEGEANKYPKLAGNSSVLSDNPASLIRLVLEGGEIPRTSANLEHPKMPSFAKKLGDRHIAEVLTFIRSNWGNGAAPVTERDVALLRSQVAETR